MQMYAGIDLHSSNNYICIIDEHDKRIFGKRLDNHLLTVLSVLEPFKSKLDAIKKIGLDKNGLMMSYFQGGANID